MSDWLYLAAPLAALVSAICWLIATIFICRLSALNSSKLTRMESLLESLRGVPRAKGTWPLRAELRLLGAQAADFDLAIQLRDGFVPNVRTEEAYFTAPVLWLGPKLRFFPAPRRLFGSRPLLPGYGVVISTSPEAVNISLVDHYFGEDVVGVFAEVVDP